MSISNLQIIMRAAMFTPTRSGWGLPMLFWGPPGVAKSDIIEGVAESFGMPIEVLSPGERGEGAFGVTPMPDADGFISYPPPRWTEKFIASSTRPVPGGLVFIDEINTAPPAIQSALMGLLLKRRIGGDVLDRNVRMMAAANSVTDAAGGWDLAPPVANRMGHMQWEAPTDIEWTDWLMAADTTKQEATTVAAMEERVRTNWGAAWARCSALVAGFIRSMPAALHRQPPAGSPDAGRSWPSHRTWEFATRALASASVHGLTEVNADMFASAFVGSGTFGEFVTYRESADLPDPTAVLDGTVKFSPDFARLDRTYAVVSGTMSIMTTQIDELLGKDAKDATKVLRDKKLSARYNRFIDLLNEVSVGASDLCWSAAKMLARRGLHDVTPEAKKMFKRMLPLVNHAEAR